MGDADNEVAVPVEEIEEWMNQALEVVDEGIGSLVEFMAYLSLCANQLSLNLKNMENFRRCFTALNLLIVPVVIAMFLCYETGESSSRANYNNSYEDGYQTLATFLIFFSGCIGLPFYLYSAWEYYGQEEPVKEECRQLGFSECQDDDSQMLEAMVTVVDGFANFLSGESSVDRLHDFSRLLSNRMQERARLETEEVSRSPDRGNEDNSPNSMNASDSTEEANSPTGVKTGKQNSSEVNEKENAGVNFPVLYQFQIRMRAQSPDLDIKIEPCDDEKAEPINRAGKLPYDEQNPVGDLLLL